MSLQEPDEQDEKPLDPVMENVRRKMIRLQLVSAGVMLVMLMAVLGAIVYKVTRPSAAPSLANATAGVPSDAPLAATAVLPQGFEITDTSLSGGQILFFGTLAGVRKALVYDIAANRIVADISVPAN
ncbi:hypothetical protein C8J38_108129 [Rhizobium sp. PP-WC-2G-219]|uniref:hypothetical protein n=1 Tax=Rhizobium sp. 9140 TaxID=1761900 RepID=UPI00079827B9|nr:hypothetical protein [Rhizobium sp. 9140]PYE24663.1 hypothetical protein C8J32_105248 [Rhizobium sp. PP-CC-3A-592]TCL90412.1 hypothetical protein C8J38_108129 [Rhizobium sp. PP-WC-2G-219]CZT36338.1 hypothetical protein GA0004734_00033370 [Rhizobium sp. 9140]